MNQSYTAALAELFKAAAMYRDLAMTGQLAKLLELSMQPTAALKHWRTIRRYMETVADTMTLQDIDDYLEAGARL